MSWIFLLLGVMAEALSHVALKATDGFTRPLPAVMVILGHLTAFIFLGQAMKGMPVGVMHALWAGMAIVTVTLLSALFYRQHLDMTAWVGMLLVALGVVMINTNQYKKVIYSACFWLPTSALNSLTREQPFHHPFALN